MLTVNDDGARQRGWSRRYLLASTSAIVAAAICTSDARAQAQAGQPASDADAAIEEIVVTGSRLVRRDLTAPSPVVTIGGDAFRESGNVTVAETLDNMPQLTPSNSRNNGPGGGSGVLTADLRGMGPERTLVLVNGRRFTPATTEGFVDLTSIPDALVSQAEIITGGASAVYGSDAVAGAINFTLKNDFEGFDLQYHYGQTFRGDGETNKVDVTMGANFDDGRGNVVVAGSFTDSNAVRFEDRAFSRDSLFEAGGELVLSGSGNIPGTRIGLTNEQLSMLQGVNLETSGDPNFGVGEGCSSVTGVRFGENGQPLAFCDPQDRFNFAEGNNLLRPLERWQISALSSYELHDNVEAYTEMFFMNNRNSFRMAPDAFAPESFGEDALLLPNFATNPVLPQATRDFFSANAQIFDPDGDGTATITSAGRRAVEVGPRMFDFDRTNWSVTAGFRGDVPLGALGDWDYDVYYQFQRSLLTENTQNEISSVRLGLGVDVVVDPDTGEPECRVQLLNCVPVNVFGLDSISPEAAAFLGPAGGNDEKFQRQVISGSISGTLFELPAGPISMALGGEYRDERFDIFPGLVNETGELGDPPVPRNSGQFDVTELFGEARIPILADLPAIESFALETGVRWADYSTAGSVWAFKLGVDWVPIDWVTVRAQFNRAVRAPNLQELFAPVGGGFSNGSDPCDVDNNPSQAQKDLCVDLGVPASAIDNFNQIGLGFTELSGGNPDLVEEESDTWTVGAVISPPWLDGFNVTFDYYKIDVEDAIDAIAAQTILDTCFQLLDASSVFCQSIDRLPDGQIDQIFATTENIAALEVSGFDLGADYGMELPEYLALPGRSASLDLQVLASWQVDDKEQSFALAPVVDCAGRFSGICSGRDNDINPNFKGQFNLTWLSGPVTFRAQTRWLGDVKDLPTVDTVKGEISDQIYVDLVGTVRVLEYFDITAGVDNLFDNQPPVLGFGNGGDSNTDVAVFDVEGSRFFFQVRAQF